MDKGSEQTFLISTAPLPLRNNFLLYQDKLLFQVLEILQNHSTTLQQATVLSLWKYHVFLQLKKCNVPMSKTPQVYFALHESPEDALCGPHQFVERQCVSLSSPHRIQFPPLLTIVLASKLFICLCYSYLKNSFFKGRSYLSYCCFITVLDESQIQSMFLIDCYLALLALMLKNEMSQNS